MKARKNKRQPGFLRKTLAVVIAITMAVTLFVPLASFADPVVVAPGSDAVEYGDAALWQTPDASEPSAETANGGDDVDLPEDSVENNGVEVEGDFIPIMPLAGEPISIMPMGASSFGLEWDDVPAANRAGVSTWAEFCAAWDNTAISYIRLESDIARGTVATRPGLLDRDLVLDGNGKLLNVGTQTENVTLRLSTAANAPRDFTVKDINVVRQVPLGINARNVFIAVSDAASGATAGAGWSTWLAISAGPSSVTDNWTINMRNVVGEGIQRGELVHNINGTIYATGEIKWIHAVANTNAPSMSNTSDSYTCGTMNARMLTFDAADVWLETSSRSAPLRSAIHSTENRIEFIGGTKATLINHRQNVFSSTIQMGFNFDTGAAPGAAAVLATKVDLVFDGEGTEVNIQGRQIGWLDEAGMVNLGGGAGGVTVTNGAKVYAENIATAAGGPGALETGATASGPAFMQSIRANSFGDSYFIVDGEGSELHATSNVMRRDTDTYMHGVIWIRAGANAAVSTLTSCEFRVSNGGHINVLRKQEDGAGKSAGISFHGSNNRFTVESGGVVKVVNEGDTRNATGTDLRNSAVNFAGTDWGFYVKDEGSAVELYAERGAAVAGAHASGADTNNNNGEIVIEPGATIIMHGNVPNGAIVNGGTNFNFSFEEPRYYDFANFAPSTAAAPARVFRTNTASGVEFNSIHSDLAVWGNGTSRSSTTGSADSSMNPAGNPTWGVAASWSNPYMSWTLPTLTLTGQSFNGATFSSNNPLLTDAAGNFGNQGTQPYRRVQGNNATPRIDSMWEPATNADKYLRAIGSVPEGLDNVGRPIWTDEVYGRYEITRAADNSKEISKNGEVTSLIAEDIYEVETGVASLDGVVRYTDGDFLRAGDTFTMLSLWRGLDYPGDNANPEEVHMAKPEDMPGPITVIDILPPVPAEITMPNNGKLWQNLTTEVSGSWLPEAAQAAAEPHNPDPAVKLYAVLKSGGSTTTISEGGNPVEGVLNADGTWLYTFPDSVISSLALNDEVYFVLEDAEGNANPLVDTPCHDTTLLAAPHLTVQAPELTLSHEDQVIGLRQATEIADLGTDSAPQYAALKDLINARADKLYPAVTLDTAVSVNKVTPPWDSPAYYDLEDFKASNPDGKTYAVRYAADADTSIYKSGSVKVEPYIEAKKYIAANDFDITVSNATTLMNKSTADRDTELIALAEAVGRLNITDPWNASLVRVASVAIPNPAEAGDWDVTFYINGQPQDYDHTVTIKAHVTSGNTPVILVDAPINVWLGDATEPFMAAGGERPDGSILPSEVDYMDGVSAFYAADSNVDITGDVTYDDSAVDLTKKGIYPVTYSVTNSDGNDATATRPVLVGDFVVIDGYIIDATSFVKERSEANAATILDDAQAYAWEMDLSEPSGLKDATPMVVSAGTYGAGSPVGTYPIRIGVVGAPSNVYRDIEAVLVDKDQMTDAVDPDTNIRYIIGANDVTNLMVSEAADYAGLSDAAQLKLINASEAEAWRLMSKAVSLGTGFPVTSLADAGVYVVSNDIPATGGSHGQSYKVTFAITSVPSITVDVTYTLFGAGPVIAFQEEPLVIDFQSGSDAHNLTFAEITDQMTATDYAARSILNPTDVTYTINGSPTAQINTGNVGVYKVVYTATDDNGMTATATRAIIIDDGRFEIDTDNDVIIGAKNFVATSASVNGSMGQVLSWSRAVAYDIEGNTIDQSNLTIDPFPPTGYTTNAPAGTYDFTWTVVGKPTKKTIKGVITDADVIYEGGENDQYAITANHFQVNATRAAEMIASGLNDALIMEADVQVIKLVDAAPTATPRVVSNGGFTDTQDTYDLTFGAQVGTTPVITSPSPTQVMSKGIVSDGFPPELTVSTPVEIWIGDGPTPAGSITPAQYTSDDMYGVSATDVEDDAAGIPLDVVVTYLNPATGVDVTTPGMYTLRYSVEDSDGNAATADRVVVVNDGSYTVGDGRILYAKSFVTRLADVTTNPSMIESEILSKSGTKLYNGTTGAEIGLTGNLTGIMSGGYSYAAGAGVYNITINAADAPTGTISKSITGEIVDADVVGPVPAPEFGPVTYVFGSNAKQTVLEAEDTAALGAAGVLAVLEATASKYLANGNKVSPSPAVKILQDKDNYLSTFTTGDSAMGIYHFLVSDVDEETTIELNIQVGSGFDDLFIEATPKPLVVNMPVPASAVDGSGNLTRDKLMEGVVATDVKAEGAGNPTGDVRSQVVIDILDMSGGGSGSPVSAIPADVPGLYQVTYSYTDANRLTVSDSRAVFVNDGRYVFDDRYILEALSFVIKLSDVTGTSAQLIEMSEAHAWSVEGQPVAAAVGDPGGYEKRTGDYTVSVQVAGYPALSKSIRAKVINDGNPAAPVAGNQNGANGLGNSVVANNFRINVVDANALVAQKGTPAYNNAFFDRSNFSIYDRTSPTFAMAASATKALVSDGGFGDAGNQPLKQGDQFTITLRCVEDPAAETTIIAFVDNALPPSITAPVRIIWTGPAADQPAGTILQSEWTAQNGMNGVVVTDDFDADIQTKLKIGSVNGGGVFTEGNPVSLAPEMYNLWQDVSYSATDSDHNTTVETFKVLATDNFALIGDYLPMGYSFVKLSSEVDSAPAAILAETYSTLWRIKSNNPAESVPVDVSNLLFIGNDGGYTNIVKDYPILVDSYTPETGFEGHATLNLVGKVVEHDELADGFDAAMRYAVAASNGVVDYADAASVTGTGAAAATRLIAATGAEAWKIPGAAINPHDVKLVSNQIGAPGHPAVPNGEYEVVFAPVGQDDIFVTVMVTLSSGNWPEITFTQAPLVLEQTPASKPLTDADLKASMTVMDVEDGNLLTQTSVTVEGGLTLNQNNIGVWQVDYSVTDSHGNTTTASRAVVITDGRYIIDPNDDVIIGARDYVVASKDVEGSEGQARSLSYAEAFSISGERLAVNWTGQPAGYTANAPAGNYPITWKAQGRNTTKAITARVVDADVIDSGGKDSSYAILANHFQVNVADAQGILNGGQAAFIEAASAEVVKLVPSVADRAPVLVSSDGFTAAEGIYEPITFKIDGIPETEQSASVRGIVSQGSLPTITASTPLEVWIGTGPKPASAITAAQYSALYDVTASDPEDGNLTSAVTYTADAATGDVDVTQVGMYKLTYDVVDSDGNHPAVLPTRMVIVNDGRYVVGSNRILSAESFVTLLEDVTTNPSLINTEILLKSSAALYNGETGALVSSTDLSVVSTGGYGRVEGSYNIIIEGIDSGTSKISRAIVGEVIDAQVIDYGPKPNDPDQDTYYVYGNNIELEVFEAEAITTDAQLLAALGAGARVARPNGTLGDITPIIADRGGFKAETGTYWVTIQDPDGNASARLSVKVNPTVLPWIDATPKPLEYTYRLGSTDMLSRADIMSGVTAGDGNDGSLTSRVVINPDATNAEQLPAIAWGSASVTQITYSVTNNNGFTETVDRALIVNDGSIRFDDRYILQGKSFLIEAKDVTLPYNTLIMEQTEAQAWHTDGTPATAVIRDAGGFGPVKGDYGIVLTVQEDVALTRSVTAKVVDSNIGNGDQYSIEAKDFRINLADARALQAKSGAAYDSEFLSRSGAASYLRADANLSRGGTPALTNDGGFKTATFALESDPAYPSTFQVSFWVTEDHSAAVTITVTVSNGNYPWIEVPGLRQTPLNSTFDYMGGVTYGDAEDATELLVTSYTNTVDTALEGVYEVTYTVTDTEGNTTEATGFVLVGDWMIDGDYAVTARNFVTTAADVEAASSLDGLITALSKADAIQVVRNDQDIITGIEHIAPIVKDRANLAAAEGTYEPIKIGVAEPTPVIEIQATVLDRDVISNTPDENGNVNDTNTDDPTDANRYVVAANHVTLTWSQAGALAGKTDAATKATLIELAEAEGFKISPEGNLSAHAVDVPANGNGVKQEIGAFDVTFIPQNVGGVSVTVQFTVAKSGSPTFSVDGPLVVPTTPGSSILTDDQLLDGVDVSDPDNANLGLDDVAITDHTRDARPLIDTSRVGVHQVVYTVEDPVTGEPTSVTRAVVVDDGRFVTDSDTQTIVGAKNFVVAAKDPAFAGSLANAIALSAAEAYDFEGEPLTVALTSTLPAGFASKTPGVYDFTFAAQGIASPTTTITGEVVDADVVDLGPDPYASQYALIASNFTMTVAEAAGVVGEAGLIDAASVRVIKLVSSAADANPVVVNNGGFTAVRGDYPLTFAIAGVDPAQRQPINVVGTVTDDSPPTLSVTAPFEITPGTTWDDIVAMTGVSATDAAGNDITDQVTFTPETMDTSQVGIHQVTYTVTDDEGNTTTTTRAVVVNDGRYVLGQGRILEANSFVIRLADVVANSSQMSQHLIGQTQAHVYDGVTGDELPASLLSIADTGNYQRSIGAYDIVVAAADDPAGTITKAIVGTVVDADVIEDNPLDPDDPNGPVMYVFGKNTTMRVAEAAAILGARPMGMMLMAADRLVSDDALIEALLGGAILADPITGNELKPVKVLSTGGFAAVPGTYKVVLADVDEIAQAELTVSVTAGEPPVVNVPRPLKLPVSSTPGNLTSDQMKGSSTAYDPEDGDLTNRIEVIGDVPGDEPGIYVVTLRVTDSDGNETIVTSAFVVDDGSFVFGDDYILSAHDFTIAHSDVDLGNKSGQIIAQSGAVAARYDGTPAVVNVTADGGYTNVGGQYAVQISVASEPSLKTNITATVTAPANNRYAVKFDPNGGTLTGPSTIYVVEPATTLSYLPSSPVRDGYVFTYWALTPEGGTQFTPSTPVLSDMTVYAQWEKAAVPPAPEPAPAPASPKGPSSPKTGDDTNPWVWVGLLGVSAAGLGLAFARRRRSSEEEDEG